MPITFKGSAFEMDADTMFKKNAKRLIAVLKELGVKITKLTFIGSGDSGDFNPPTVEFSNGAHAWSPTYSDATGATIEWTQGKHVKVHTMVGKYVNGNHITLPKIENVPVFEAITKVCEAFVDAQNVDWYNNDGGFGYVNLIVDPPGFCIDISQNTVSSESVYYDADELA